MDAGKASYDERWCFKQLWINLDTELSIWAQTDDYLPIATRLSPRFPRERYISLFQGLILSQLQRPQQREEDNGLQARHVTFVVRSRAGFRPTLFAEHIEAVLRTQLRGARSGLGLRVVDLGVGMSLQDQVSLLASTAVLVADHGAGMSNMVFMPSGGVVIEIWHAGGDYFSPIAAIHGLLHFKIDRRRLQAPLFKNTVRRALDHIAVLRGAGDGDLQKS